MAKTINCGFARGLVLSGLSQYPSYRIFERIVNDFELRFENLPKFWTHDKGRLRERFKDYSQFIKSNKVDQSLKSEIISTFSDQTWATLSQDEKLKHSLQDCTECANSALLQRLPVGVGGRKRKHPSGKSSCGSETPVTESGAIKKKRTPLQDVDLNIQTPKITPEDKIDVKNVIDEYDRTHDTPMCEVIPTMKFYGLMKKPTKIERQKEQRSISRKLRYDTEKKQQIDNRDMYAVTGTNKSFNSHDIEWRHIHMESKAAAIKRSRTAKKRKVKVPDNFDKEGLLNYVNALPDDSPLPLTKLANMFGVDDKNHTGNKVVKQFLIDSGVDLERFDTAWVNRARRRYLKDFLGLSQAMPRSAKKLKKALREEIRKGNLCLGELISPKTFSKISLDKKTNKIIAETFVLSGRKIPLKNIREKINKDHVQLGILRELPELKRYLAVWADHASILNHGYLLLTVKPIFSEVIYYTNAEMAQLKGGNWNVQEIVERPSVYIFGRSNDSILEKLSYVETRAEDIKALTSPTEINGQVIHDIMRFFHGDHPELQYESGNQQGGHFPCLCCTRIDSFTDLAVVFRSEIQDPQTRLNFLRKGPLGRTNKAKPYDNLKSEAVLEELRHRDPPLWQECQNAADREKFLKNVLQGIVRPPALLFDNTLTLEDIPHYEICPCEPLHDLKGHIANIWTILPEYLSYEERKEFDKAHASVFKEKDQAKGSDYRISAIIIYEALKDIVSQQVRLMLYSLTLVTKLAYLPAEKRSPRIVLLTYNITFLHAVTTMNVIGKSPKSTKITKEKFYGVYSHSIFAHFPSVQRIIPLSSMHCESNERTFTGINRTSKACSNRHLEDVRDNGIIRIQCQMKLKYEDPKSSFSHWQSQVSKAGRTMGKIENTVIWPGICDDLDYQAHLERIGDFLLLGEGVWWHLDKMTGNYVFHDGDGEPEHRPEGPLLQTFAECSLSSTYDYLKLCWKQCIERNVVLPIASVVVYDEEGNFQGKNKFEHALPPLPPDDEEGGDDELTELDLAPVISEQDWAPNTLFPPMKKTEKKVDKPQPKNELLSVYDDDGDIKSPCGKAILKTLGPSKALTSFEKVLRMMNIFPMEQKYHIEYNKWKRSISAKLIGLLRKAKAWCASWEEEFLVESVMTPTIEDIRQDKLASIVYDKKHLIEKILSQWEINH